MRHQKSIYTMAFYIVGREDVAKEITNETFMKFYRKIKEFNEEKGFVLGYLHAICKREGQLAQQKSKKSILVELKEAFFGAKSEKLDQTIFAKEIEQKVSNIIKRLPKEQQTIFFMRFYGELTIPEIATALNMNESTANSHIVRIRALLVSLLGDLYDNYLQ
jgi:RNA polymerase sigma factor (sigma-70 family)